MAKRLRLDTWLVQNGHFSSREKAKATIMAGLVRVDGEVIDKAGTKVFPDATVDITKTLHPYVSRGGLKLKKALDVFQVSMAGTIVLDIGASTGGFTDCALKHGANHVYAVDVGYGQLDWTLRQDPRVTVMERTNFRYVKPEQFSPKMPTIAVIDVSFISLDKIFPPLAQILPNGGTALALIKPQFEAGREQVGKKGVVRDPAVHNTVLSRLAQVAAKDDFQLCQLTYSPITGGEGNIEFLAHWVQQRDPRMNEGQLDCLIETVVSEANHYFQG